MTKPPSKIVRKPPAPVEEPDVMPVGQIVHDKDKHPWVYLGCVLMDSGSTMRYFTMSVPVKASETIFQQWFMGVKRATCVKQFPDLAKVWPA